MLFGLVAYFCACANPRPPDPPAPAAPPPAPAPADGLTVSIPVVLARSGTVTLESLTWSHAGDTGWAWVGRSTRDGRVEVVPSAEVRPLVELATPAEGEVIVNGGFYDDGPMGLVRHQGADVAPRSPRGGSGILVWSPGTGARIVHHDAWDGHAVEALQSIDRIVADGRSLVSERPEAPSAARTAIATTGDAVIVVVLASDAATVVVGPTERHLGAAEDTGLPLWAFAELLVGLGVTDALNLDGGISTELRARLGGDVYAVVTGPGTINAVRLSAGR